MQLPLDSIVLQSSSCYHPLFNFRIGQTAHGLSKISQRKFGLSSTSFWYTPSVCATFTSSHLDTLPSFSNQHHATLLMDADHVSNFAFVFQKVLNMLIASVCASSGSVVTILDSTLICLLQQKVYRCNADAYLKVCTTVRKWSQHATGVKWVLDGCVAFQTLVIISLPVSEPNCPISCLVTASWGELLDTYEISGSLGATIEVESYVCILVAAFNYQEFQSGKFTYSLVS